MPLFRTCGYWSHSLLMTSLQSWVPSVLCSLIVWLQSRRQYRLAHPAQPPVSAPAAAQKPPSPPAQQKPAAPVPVVQEKK